MSGRWSALAVTVGSLAAYSLAANTVLDGAGQRVAAVALAVGLLLLARHGGVSLAELGVDRQHLRDGLRWGLGVALPAAAAIALVSLLPLARTFFTDLRVAELDAGEVAVEALVRIAVGTALFEELLFRGVLLGMLLGQLDLDLAVAWQSLLFGLWHVLPALAFADANEGLGSGGGADVLAVVVTVVATALGGAALAWLRLRSGSLAAPVIVHAAVNSTALVAAWFVTR
jgi:CAAX protease family protein